MCLASSASSDSLGVSLAVASRCDDCAHRYRDCDKAENRGKVSLRLELSNVQERCFTY
jgi:hypothetical protein